MVIVVDITRGGGGGIERVLTIFDHTVVLVPEQPIAAGTKVVFIGARPWVRCMMA